MRSIEMSTKFEKDTETVRLYFNKLLSTHDERGDIGFARFSEVYDSLMPTQKRKLESITKDVHRLYVSDGSFISFCVSFKDPFIDQIDDKTDGSVDYELWNEYAKEYHRINQILNSIAEKIAKRFGGIPLKATIGGIIGDISHVKDYFPMVISHRAIAEKAGLGWRGKNQLVIHEKFSCAIRFASVIVPRPLVFGVEMDSKCGSCTACEDVCGFIKHRSLLPDYRENCRRYILYLKTNGISKDICGKCIKACYRASEFREQFELPKNSIDSTS